MHRPGPGYGQPAYGQPPGPAYGQPPGPAYGQPGYGHGHPPGPGFPPGPGHHQPPPGHYQPGPPGHYQPGPPGHYQPGPPGHYPPGPPGHHHPPGPPHHSHHPPAPAPCHPPAPTRPHCGPPPGHWGTCVPANWMPRPQTYRPPTAFAPTRDLRPGFYYVRGIHGDFLHVQDHHVVQSRHCDWDKRIYLQDLPGHGRFAIRDADNGKILCFDQSGRLETRTQVGPWETLEIRLAPGSMNRFNIYCPDRRKWLCSLQNSTGLGQAAAPKEWEQWEFICA